jgi:hypothetical protein
VITNNGGNLNFPKLKYLPFLSNPSEANVDEKLMFIKGLELEHRENCNNINCRCREVFSREELRRKKSDHNLRLLGKQFFIQLSIIREMIHSYVKLMEYDKEMVMLYCYFLTNFQNMNLIARKIAHGKI